MQATSPRHCQTSDVGVDTPESQAKRARQCGSALHKPVASPAGEGCSERTTQFLSGLHQQLWAWHQALRALHPACGEIPSGTIVLALGLFREYAAQTQLSLHFAQMQPLITFHTLGVCFWAAIKFTTNPGSVPNSKFMAKATGLQNQLLLALEPEVLRAVNWRIYAIAEAVLGLEASRGECTEEDTELECPDDPAELDCQ